jgi:hypothetical protein
MKLCFVSVNGPREPYLLDKPRIKININGVSCSGVYWINLAEDRAVVSIVTNIHFRF